MDYIDPNRKLNFHLDRVAQLQVGQNPPPVNVEIDLSNRCSRGCHFCHFSHTHSRGPLSEVSLPPGVEPTGDLLDTDLALRLVKELADYGIRSITWSGGGEPTLHPDFYQIIDSTALDQGLYTHGGHINQPRAALLKQKCKWVYVSLDYPDADSYAKGKGVGRKAFGESCDGIRRLVTAAGDATIGLGFLIDGSNHLDTWKMLELSWNLGVNYVQFRPIIYFNHEAPAEVFQEGCEWMDDDFFLRMSQFAKRSDVTVDISRFVMYRDWSSHGYATCWWSGLQTVITPDGRVWACLNKRGFDGASLGDLKQDTFADIWKRAPMQQVDDRCRVLCRGHIPNLALAPMMVKGGKHRNFI
jgi:MoaA/NifB/PqqE/SkfB family radical SAM enzyme